MVLPAAQLSPRKIFATEGDILQRARAQVRTAGWRASRGTHVDPLFPSLLVHALTAEYRPFKGAALVG
jgi:hypothetical protein